jgi:hypothetical protein
VIGTFVTKTGDGSVFDIPIYKSKSIICFEYNPIVFTIVDQFNSGIVYVVPSIINTDDEK